MKISIITATYNSGATLRDTFDSILRQGYDDYEVLIQDGGSTDDTMEIVREYAPRFGAKMKAVSEKDNGLYDAMNRAIRRATGDVVGILNSDDFYTTDDVLENVVSHFTDDIDAVYGDVHFVNPEDLHNMVRYYSSRLFRPWMLRFGYMPAHPSFYVRREVYERYGTYSLDYKLAADYDMMVRLFCYHKIRARYIHRDFVTMRTGGLSTASMKNRMQLTKEDMKACRNYGMYTNPLFICCKYIIKVFEYR